MFDLLAQALEAVRAGARLALDPGEALQVDTKRNRNDVVTQIDRGVENLIAHMLEPTGYPLVGEESHAAESWEGRVWVLDPIDGTLNYVAVHRHWAISLALVEEGVPIMGIVADPVDDRLYVALAGQGAWEGRLAPDMVADGGLTGTGDVAAAVAQLVPQAHKLGNKDAPLADGVVIAQMHALTSLSYLSQIIRDTRGLRTYGAAALELAEVAAGRAGCLVHTRLHPWDVAAGVLVCQEAGVVVTRLDGTSLEVAQSGSLVAGVPSAHEQMVRRLVEG